MKGMGAVDVAKWLRAVDDAIAQRVTWEQQDNVKDGQENTWTFWKGVTQDEDWRFLLAVCSDGHADGSATQLSNRTIYHLTDEQAVRLAEKLKEMSNV